DQKIQAKHDPAFGAGTRTNGFDWTIFKLQLALIDNKKSHQGTILWLGLRESIFIKLLMH
ncbi:MAG: hypothetical protein IPP53_12295, partial [Bacteroidetes bacterium]|nr:hypothetical protein [Bacteroidota bacterium]